MSACEPGRLARQCETCEPHQTLRDFAALRRALHGEVIKLTARAVWMREEARNGGRVDVLHARMSECERLAMRLRELLELNGG